MQRLHYILLLLIASLTLSGCMEQVLDGPMVDSSELVTLTVDIRSSAAVTKGGVATRLEEDYTIQTLRVFVVDQWGAIESNNYSERDASWGTDGVYCSFEVVQSPTKKLYVVVNEPQSLASTLQELQREAQLSLLSYEIAEALNNEQFIAGESIAATNLLIPMGASLEVDASADCRVVVDVDRVVARVDLMVDKDEVAYSTDVQFGSDTKVSVTGLYYSTSLFAPRVLPTPSVSELVSVDGVQLSGVTSLSLESSDRSSAKRLLSFYIAERTYEINEQYPSENRIAINIDNITVGGELITINSTIVLGNYVQPYLEEINRNYVYVIYATYNGEEQALEVSAEYVIQDWEVEEVDADIEGVMLSVTNQVVMDWTRLNSSFTASDISFGSNRTIEFYVPTSYDILSGEYEYTKCNFVAQSGATYDLRDLSQYGIADEDNYLLSVPWLTAATIAFDSYQTGRFEFTYQLGDTPNYLDAVSLQLLSGNIRKELEIIYDNGYVPGELIQANDIVGCWGDAPNGIVFAKRGDALHPLTTDDVILCNSQGLYEGDITMTADEADQYCKDNLGPKWYAPNSAQLADIQRHVLELGTSYRYNNTAESYYWSSEIDSEDNYWAINLEKGLYEPAPVSAPCNLHYYVRCITNL